MNENNNETPVEMTVGEMLRTARTTGRRKREISTVSKQLCIREEFLQALEDGNYSVIPETVYILGFARNYAMELGLDPDDVVNKLKREMGLLPDDDESGASDKETIPESGAGIAVDSAKAGLFVRAQKYVMRNWAWFVGGLAVIALIVVALILFIPAVDSKTIPASDEVHVVVEQTEPNYTVAVRERFGTENSENADVILQATAESWVKIEDGRGNTVFSRVLVPGDIYYVPAGDGYKATFGNAGGVDVWVDGKLAPKQGADHTRKSGISMNPNSLMPAAATTNQ